MRRPVKASRWRPRRRRTPRDKKLVYMLVAALTKFSRFFTKLRHLLWAIPSLLPPPKSPEKKTVFLDLDHTLIHCTKIPPPPQSHHYDFIMEWVTADGVVKAARHVRKRPGVDEFLAAISRDFEVVVFTAGQEAYASPLLDALDRKGVIFAHRLYRDSCTSAEGGFVKDLSRVGRDLGRVVIVDDKPISYSLQPENAIPVRRFSGDQTDRELLRLIEFFKGHCRGSGVDMRVAAAKYRSGRSITK